jgi:tetratricopeptide (TPR) repeat protein/tRNA A-37 threonylcarbamoyl transferase component Bud32
VIHWTISELADALRDRYAIERELGRGGMATIYLAQDLKHARQVALKVLHPEIAAGLGPERFLREIRLTARLQHPHILPVFDSDASVARLWYTMPYVRGESLRDRLRRERRLPLEPALEIARQVALALDYAHREGAVHRDIKPENILLSDGQALVADFGVARAIGSAGEEQLTATGLAIGTPAYMSPEQACGGEVDGRTDVYALGCMLYEMLAGEPPFTGPTPQAIIAKRFAQPAPSLGVLYPGVPPGVEDAIRTALATAPDDRFPTAAAFARALTGTSPTRVGRSTKIGGWSELRRKRARKSGIVAIAALGLMGVGYLAVQKLRPPRPTLLSTGVLRQRERVLIADFQSRAPDSLLGLAATEAFRTDFAQSSVVTTISTSRTAEVLERMRQPATARLDPALAREVAIRQGIKAMVTGEVTPLGKSYLLSAQLVSPESGEVLAAQRETAEDATRIVPAIDRLSKQLRGKIGESLKSLRNEPPLDKVTTSSLEALWKYTQAIRAGDGAGDYAKGVSLLEEAVALDTGFATAYRVLGGYFFATGQRERGVEAFTRAIQYRERLTDLERDHTMALYYGEVTFELDKSIAAYRAALDRHPNDSLALNNLALHYSTLGQPARAESLFRRLIALDSVQGAELREGANGRPDDPKGPNAWLNLAQTQLALGKRREAELTFRQAVEKFGNQGFIESFGVVLPGAVGDYSTAEIRAKAFMERHAEADERRFVTQQLAQLASARGRLVQSEHYLREAMAVSARESRATPYLEDAVSLGFLDMWFRRQPKRGLEPVEAALGRYRLAALKPLDRPYLSIALAYALAGRPQKARALLTEYEREVKPMYRRRAEPLRRWAWGHVAMAENRVTDAIREFQAFAAASPRDCKPCGLAAVGQAYDRAGQRDSAIAMYERYITTPDINRLGWILRLGNDGTQLAPAHKRLGELYEQRGDRVRARNHYNRFVELWQECDPELRPAVLEVKQRLLQLGGEGSLIAPQDRARVAATRLRPSGRAP